MDEEVILLVLVNVVNTVYNVVDDQHHLLERLIAEIRGLIRPVFL